MMRIARGVKVTDQGNQHMAAASAPAGALFTTGIIVPTYYISSSPQPCVLRIPCPKLHRVDAEISRSHNS